jgi:hypothetical protein
MQISGGADQGSSYAVVLDVVPDQFSFLTLTGAFGPFLFWTFDDLFFRLAMVAIPVRVGASQRIDAESKTARLSRGDPGYQLSTDDLSLTLSKPARSKAAAMPVAKAKPKPNPLPAY